MKESRYDRVMGKMLNRVERVSDRIATEFKHKKPFDKEVTPNKERIFQYSQLTPEMENTLRQSMGNEVVDNYKNKMNDLMRRQQ